MLGSLIRRSGRPASARVRRRPDTRWRAFRWLFGSVFGILVIAAIGVLLLMVRLAQGPIEVDAIGQRIASSLNARTGGHYSFVLGATSLHRADFGPALVIDDFRVTADGQTVVEAPHAEVSIDPLALLSGDLRPRRLQVSNIDINLVVLADGSISIAGGQRAAPIAVSPAPAPRPQVADTLHVPRAALLAQAGTALRNFFDFATARGGAIGVIERIGIKSGRLLVEDNTTDHRTVFDDLDVEFTKRDGATDLVINARGPNGPLAGEAHAQGVSGELRTLDLAVRDLTIDELVLAGGVRHPTIDTDVRVAANARFALDPAGKVREANASFGLSSGYVRLEDPDHEPYFIDEFSGSAHWDAATRRIIVDPTHLFAADTRLSMIGTIDPPTGGNEGWAVHLGLGEPGTLAPERPGEQILAVNDLAVEGTVLPFSQRALLDRGVLKGPDIDVQLKGQTDWTDGLHVTFTGQAGQGPLRALLRVWPSHVAAGMRAYLIGHTHGGTVRSATMSADFDHHSLLMMRYNRPPPDDKLTMDFNIVNGSIDTWSGLPPITDLDAKVHITGRTLHLAAKAGTVDIAPNRRLTLLDGTLDMPRNDGSDAVPAHLALRASGPVEAAADLLSRDSMRSVAQLPVDPGSLHGKIDGRIAADFEIGPQAQSKNTTFDVNLTASDFAVDHIIGKERLEAATVSITNDQGGFKANGNGRLFGGPVSFDLRKPAGQSATAVANLTLDDAARARAGFPLTGVTGPIGARINATLGGDGTKAQVDLDLTRTGIENGIPGLVKPAGKPARLAFTLDSKGPTILLDQLTFEGAGATAKGVVELGSDGGFQAARFSQMRLSAGDDFKADIQKGADGIKIAVRAVNLDARPFLKLLNRTNQTAPGTGGDFDLDLKAPVVTGFGKQALSNVDLRLVRRASTIKQFTMNGGFGRKPVVVSMVRSEGSAPQVSIVTPDAGALFAFTDLYGRMEGGALQAVMQMEAGRVTGTVQVQNFVLKDEPALRRLAVEGVPQQPAAGGKPLPRVDGNQVQFDRLHVVFTHGGGRLDIRDGLMNGQMMGLTVEGSIDDGRDTLNLSGTYVPAYGINNLFSKIPVVGVFLGGGWNEGLFAVNYHIAGTPSSPVLSINPLSAVAPGFLRKIFGALDGSGQPQGFPTQPSMQMPGRTGANRNPDPFGTFSDPTGGMR